MTMTAKITFPELEVWFLLVLMIGADAAHMMSKNCSHIALNSSVILLGNPLRATLLPRSGACTVDYKDNPIDVVWQLDKDEILRSRYSALNDQVLTVTIPSFNQLKGNLTCSVLHNGSLQLLQWVEVRAGYPPMKPHLLLCKSYWTSFAIQSIVCNWDPGSETHLETNYTLHVSETIGKCATRYLTPKNCTTSGANNSCMVLVSNLVSYHDIWVTAENDLGTEMSNHKCLDGMLIVKFRAPRIIEVTPDAEQNGCLIGQWMMPFEMTDHTTVAFEIRYKELDDERWIQVALTMINSTFFRLCHLLPYTEYQMKIRCKQKTETSPWSDWSNEKTGITAESVPTQKLQLWRSIETPNAEGIRRVHLMWKPLKKTAANGEILGYRVWLHKPELRVHNASISERFIHLPDGNYRIQVSAYNSVGESPKADIVIPSSKNLGLPSMSHILAFSNGNNSILVQWEPPNVPTTGYVVEWCAVSVKIACSISWQNVAANVTEVTIQDTIEPIQLYNISVYPICEDLPGFPSSTQAYSKEGAPRRSPEIRSKQIWKTKVHFEWKELPIDDRNGFIRNYTILYKNRNGKLKSVVINSSEHNCILTDLLPNMEYDVTIVASTDAGSATGYNLAITTKMIDDGEVELFLMCIFLFSLFLTLALIGTCIYQRQRIKKHIWPNIPDAANSTLAHWMPKTLWQVIAYLYLLIQQKRFYRMVEGRVCKLHTDSSP
ncbi:interleukin-6 receptor subunit beta-like isoform X1 [Leucoraja erinacea]|uniref:interleukin-6 receptor subunit beta-like isoform X1 n=1 Tax=Leucoraja erinaceus TaxID=7782 RepID=UPI002454F177|nr:interleukin-6 receptor subunit beta-like isoform X1 [Leucoraja erinacea]XP_055514886.1 interleukin-6 receptor subunit beta-like isoform X1 [Leucoraja erinacea]